VMLYAVAIAVHVLAAVLAVGIVGAIPLTARLARLSEGQLAATGRILGALLRAVQVGLAVMFLTGVLLDVSVSGAFHRTSWFKVSIALLALVGISHARARAALRRAVAPGSAHNEALRRLEQWGWAMCASVALITLLMQTKLLP
jgi:hypothetical protein